MITYSFSHLIQAWLLPPGINIFLMIAGLLIWFFSRKLGSLVMMAGVITLWLLSMPFVAYNMIGILQNKYTMLDSNSPDDNQKNDAIVVLGGGDAVDAEYGNKQRVSDFTLHRLDYAAYLHQKTNLPIVVSGGRENGAIDSEADLMTKALRDTYQITTDLKEDKSMTTADESTYLRSLLKQNRFNQVYLVTNAWHMPRSVYIFQCAGIKVTPAPMGYYVYGPGYALISFMPNIDALDVSSIAIHEFIGLVWYHFSYGKQCA